MQTVYFLVVIVHFVFRNFTVTYKSTYMHTLMYLFICHKELSYKHT